MSYSVVFCGTPEFAVPPLLKLIGDSDFEVKAVLSQPDRPAGRGKKLKPSPIKETAIANDIPVFTPEKVSHIIEEIKAINADLAVVVAYGQILPQSFLDIFKFGCVNIHSSLLPRWRGAAPMQRAIMEGDDTTGVSLQKIVQKLDAGDIIGERVIDLPLEMGATELYSSLSALGAELLEKELKQFLQGHLTAKAQDESLVTYAHKISKEEALLDWKQSALQIHNKVRGLDMGPFTYTTYQDKQLKIRKTIPLNKNSDKPPGVIVAVGKDSFEVSCGKQTLEVLEVQPESKAKMKVGDFIRGYHLKEGDQLG